MQYPRFASFAIAQVSSSSQVFNVFSETFTFLLHYLYLSLSAMPYPGVILDDALFRRWVKMHRSGKKKTKQSHFDHKGANILPISIKKCYKSIAVFAVSAAVSVSASSSI